MARRLPSPAVAILGLSLALSLGLGGCASGGMIDQLPAALGGEPESLPPRPKTEYQFPAVHDMPPARATAPLSDNEQVTLEKELQAARDRQEALYGAAAGAAPPPAPKPAAPAAKKPAAAKSGQTSGAKTNP